MHFLPWIIVFIEIHTIALDESKHEIFHLHVLTHEAPVVQVRLEVVVTQLSFYNVGLKLFVVSGIPIKDINRGVLLRFGVAGVWSFNAGGSSLKTSEPERASDL